MKTFANLTRSTSGSSKCLPGKLTGQQWIGQSAHIRGLLNQPTLQTKLAIGAPGDKYEAEADRVAKEVVSMSQPDLVTGVSGGQGSGVQRMCDECAEESRVQRQANEEENEGPVQTTNQSKEEIRAKENSGATPRVGTNAEPAVMKGVSGGRHLSPDALSYFEPRFGTDFSGVKIHTDEPAIAAARSVNARAFTLGEHIAFNRGEFSAASPQGRELLAHELTHVVQQSSAPPAGTKSTASRVSRKTPPRIQRFSFGAGAAPHPDYGVVPADEQDRVNAAMRIIQRMVNDRANYRACHNFFRDNCPGGTDDTFRNQFDNAVVWKDNDVDPNLNGSQVDPNNIAYTDRTFRIGRWAMAAVFIHEMMHTCGQANHDIGDQAKGVCGRLPNI